MDNLDRFKNFIESADFTPAMLGEINTLIFHEWDEKKAQDIFPNDIVNFISSNKDDQVIGENIHHALLPQNLRSE